MTRRKARRQKIDVRITGVSVCGAAVSGMLGREKISSLDSY
jgi:hypothetical protein